MNPPNSNVSVAILRNIGFVFASGDLKDIRDLIIQDKVATPAT